MGYYSGAERSPRPILALAEKQDAGQIESHYLTWKTENFVPLPEGFRKLREKDNDAGSSTSFSNKTIKGKMRKIKEAIIMTKGLSDATGIERWVYSYPDGQESLICASSYRHLFVVLIQQSIIDFLKAETAYCNSFYASSLDYSFFSKPMTESLMLIALLLVYFLNSEYADYAKSTESFFNILSMSSKSSFTSGFVLN